MHHNFFLGFIKLKIKMIIIICIFYLVQIIKIYFSIFEAFPESPRHSAGVGGDEE